MHVKIKNYSKGDSGPAVCLTFVIGIDVSVQNNYVASISGLIVMVTLIENNTGALIEGTGITKIGRLNESESGNFSVPVYYSINSLSRINPA